MPGFGWHNPFPFEFGGGDSAVERIYRALRSNVGAGGSADNDETSIDGLWRQSRAVGLACLATMAEHAALQAFPNYATDFLPYYERLFLLTPEDENDLGARQTAAAARYAGQLAHSLPELALALQRIDPRFEVVTISRSRSVTTMRGRSFEDYAGAEPFGGSRRSTAFPNYSTSFLVLVMLDLGSGVLPGARERRAMNDARALAADALPATNDLVIVTHHGFTLDLDLLDLTSLDE